MPTCTLPFVTGAFHNSRKRILNINRKTNFKLRCEKDFSNVKLL